jgi:predicted AlkP superfamily pyrophosphatase or phosphodiesterase
MPSSPAPVLPEYGGACVTSIVPALLERRSQPWLPAAATGADQVVLLVLDGLGWEQLQERGGLAPTMASLGGGPITTVAPSTTATALTSITTGRPPCEHGVVGYRVKVAGTGAEGADEVLNVLRWRTPSGDARQAVPPDGFGAVAPFAGRAVPVLTRAEFESSGFTSVHLGGARMVGWRLASTLVAEVRRALAAGEPFVYAYYDGVDRVAHEYGLDDRYDAEVAAVDRLVDDLARSLPAGGALVVTSDHGQVDVGDRVVTLDAAVLEATAMISGEGRFRWLHVVAAPGGDGTVEGLAETVRRSHADVAWVHTKAEVVAAGWFGGPLSDAGSDRLGDVAVVAHQPVSIADSGDPGEARLCSRHGSLTSAEMLVPLLVAAP